MARRFESGVAGTELLCWACPTPAAPEPTPELTLLGSEGSISVYVSYGGPGGGAVVQRPDRTDAWYGTGMAYYDPLGEVLRDWAAAVRAGRVPVSSMAEGMRDAAVMDAIGRSAEQGEPVAITI